MKKRLGSIPLVYPVPIVLIGAYVDSRANFATLGDCAVMGLKPALVAVSLSETHFTTRGIKATHRFSINIPSTAMLDRVDFCGIVSGRDVDKSLLFSVIRDTPDGPPLIEECPINLDCRVLDEIAVQHRNIFVAEVVESLVAEHLVPQDGADRRLPAMDQVDPILYALDNRYYRAGSAIGLGYEIGKRVIAPRLHRAESGNDP